MRIIFDTIERALFGTHYQEAVQSLFRYYLPYSEETPKDTKIV